MLVLSGDVPLISAETIAGLLESHAASGAAATMLTIELDEPGSYGRVVRADSGEVERMVEAKAAGDATAEQLAIREINAGTYVFQAGPLADGARRPLQRQRPGRVLPARCPAGAARGRPRGRRPPRRRPRGDDGGQQPRRPRRGRGRGAPPHPRGPHARRRHRRRPRLDLGRRRGRDRRRRADRARHQPARRDRGRRRLDDRPAEHADRQPGSARTSPCRTPTWSSATSRDGAQVGPFAYLRPGAGARARAPRRAPSSRSRTRGSARARRSRTSPTSATPRSAPAATSAPARSPPTTTVSARTGLRSARTCGSALTRC